MPKITAKKQKTSPRLSKKKAASAKKRQMPAKTSKINASPADLIDARVNELGDWRGKTLARVRALVKEADPEVIEEWKWRGVPVWSHGGIICTGETYKEVVKMTFAKGPPWRTQRSFSIPAWRGIRGAPSTFAKAKRSTQWL